MAGQGRWSRTATVTTPHCRFEESSEAYGLASDGVRGQRTAGTFWDDQRRELGRRAFNRDPRQTYGRHVLG